MAARRNVVIGLVAALLWAAAIPRAGAQESGAYQSQIEQALAEFERGNWAEARAYFIKAHRQLPTARTARGLGIVAYEMRRYVESVEWLQQALILENNPLTAAQRAEVERTLALANNFIGRYRVVLKPEDADLRVNHEPADVRDDGTIWLDVGEHHVVASAPGYKTESRELVVEGGEEETLRFELKKPAPAGAFAADGRPRDDGSVFGEWWFWTAAVAVVGGGVATALILTQEDEVQPLIPGDDGVTVRALRIAP
jgi:tetratricopeptide (TPR) repeat protein